MNYKISEEGLRKVWGNDVMDDYINYAFEFACREAEYLLLDRKNPMFRQLCDYRRKWVIEGLYETTREMRYAADCNYEELSENVKLELPSRINLEAIIRNMYDKGIKDPEIL